MEPLAACARPSSASPQSARQHAGHAHRPLAVPCPRRVGSASSHQHGSRKALARSRGGRCTALLGVANAAISAVSQQGVAANLLLWYSTLGALTTSLGAWIVYVTGVLYKRFEPFAPEAMPETRLLHGVEVSRSRFLSLPSVTAAADFAAAAHAGQHRLTGHPYVEHVIETAAIVEGLLANSARSFTLGERAEMAVIVALLHDVLDDTHVTYAELEARFGGGVADMVKKVSRLSSLNQLLRRKRRQRLEASAESAAQLAASNEEERASLHNMLLLMVDEPLVIVVKLADRLHNMRTAWALAPNKRAAVATETLEVWCTLAERLGMFALKSELEDLCFAVLHAGCYRKLHAERNELWKRNVVSPSVAQEAARVLATCDGAAEPPQEAVRGPETATTAEASTSYAQPQQQQQQQQAGRRPRRRVLARGEARELSTHAPRFTGAGGMSGPDAGEWLDRGWQRVRSSSPAKPQRQQQQQRQQQERAAAGRRERAQPSRHWREGGFADGSGSGQRRWPPRPTAEQREMRALLLTVLRFDDTTYRLGRGSGEGGAHTDLAGLAACTRRLIYEIDVEAVATGLTVHVEGRLKSLHSVWRKMLRKKARLPEIYDARAIRIVVCDEGGRRTQEAVEACYRLLATVQRLWRRVGSEPDDDYIARPKPSGYQSLHTAVIGPGGAPLEVQIRTSSMHEVAEYGRAAHWTYKESQPPPPEQPAELGVLRRGQPVARVEGRKLNLGAVLDWAPDTRRGLVIVQVASRPNPGAPVLRSEVDALLAVAEASGWCRPGDGSFSFYLEACAFFRDRKFHNTDVYAARGQATLVPLHVQETTPEQQQSEAEPRRAEAGSQPDQMDQKIRLLREVLEWGQGMAAGMQPQAAAAAAAAEQRAAPSVGQVVAQALSSSSSSSGSGSGGSSSSSSSSSGGGGGGGSSRPDSSSSRAGGEGEAAAAGGSESIIVLMFPEGDFKVVPKGTTAAKLIQGMGLPIAEGQAPQGGGADACPVVNVNNLLVPEDTQLRNGDFVVRSRDLLQI